MSDPQLVVIANPGLSAGFALAGVPVIHAADGQAASRELERLADRTDTAVVIIDEPLYRALPEEQQRGLSRATRPVVIPVPGPDWTAESTAHEYIVEILRRAIGYRVRLQ